MLISFQIIGGLALLFFGGEGLVRGAVALARNLKIPTIIIGLTIVALGTSAPELFVSINAAISNHPEIALGNIIGSNISNTLLVLAAAALIYPIKIDQRLKKFDSIVLAFSTILLLAFCWTSEVDRWEGLVLLLCLGAYNWKLYRDYRGKKSLLPEHQVEEVEELIKVEFSTTQSIFISLVGMALLVAGSELLVEGAISLAKIIGISEAVIGLTLVAIGSSAPELATCISAARNKHSDVAMGNVVGSNIINILAGIGMAASLSPLEVKQKFLNYDLWVMLAVTIVLVVLMKKQEKIGRKTGVLFFITYIAYIFTQFIVTN